MLQKKSSLALIPKARGLFAHRLTEGEYDELMHKRSVAEIGAYLKNHPYFRDSLSGIQDTQVHRRRLEELLSRDIYYKYEALRRYDFSSGSFAHFFIVDCEVQELLYALHLLATGSPGDYITRLPSFLADQTCFDLLALARARSFADILRAVAHTPYHRLLQPLLTSPAGFNYAACEHALRSYYYETALALVDKTFNRREAAEVRELFTREAEIYNLDIIYRIKAFFPDSYSAAEIEALLLPVSCEIPPRRLQEMARARGLKELATAYKGYGYGRAYGDFEQENSSACAWRHLYQVSARILRFSSSPGTVLAAVLLLAKIERGNLITIIEGVRYGMDPANIRVLLKY